MSLLGAVSTFPGRGRTPTSGVGLQDAYLAVVDATNTGGSLIAHWRLGSNLTERIAGRNATLGAGVEAYTSGLPFGSPGAAFDCAGANWLTVPHAAALKPAVGSLMAWFRPSTIHNGVMVSANALGTSNPADFTLRVIDNGTVSCFFQQSAITHLIITASAYYTLGQIVHAIVTFDAGGFALYLDGNLIEANTDHTSGLNNNTVDWRFGSEEAGAPIFNGALDEIALWNRVLTRNEIYQLSLTEPDE